MRVLLLTDNFPPEVNAPATRSYEHCREWVAAGAQVTVITGAPNFPAGRLYDGYVNRIIQKESVDGIDVIRVWTYMAPNAGFAKRIIDYVSFAFSGFLAGLGRNFDVVIATSPQFFTTLTGAALGFVKRRPWVFELRDLWPESIVATGAMRPGRAIRLLERLELALYKNASMVVAVTDAFKADLVRRGIAPDKVVVVPNGVLPERFRVERGSSQTESSLTVGYVGTHGLAHGLEVVLEAAEILRGQAIRFVLVGDGARKVSLVAEAAQRGLDNVEFREPVQRADVPALLAEFDAALVPLRRSPAFKTVIPSKIFEAAAAGLPIILGVEGQAKDIVVRYRAGIAHEPEDAEGLADCVRRLATDRELRRTLSEGSLQLAAAYDRRSLAREMLDHLHSAAGLTPASPSK